MTCAVSAADFSALQAQCDDALAFLSRHEAFMRDLASFPGVESITLDFAVEIQSPFGASFVFPPDLLAAMGRLGVHLALSTYPAPGSDSDDT